MKMKKIFFLVVMCILMFASCSEERTMKINGKDTIVPPYGLFNTEQRNDSAVYKLSTQK
jgi:PBP1b-binding outer membrane lipoprotein LpoB